MVPFSSPGRATTKPGTVALGDHGQGPVGGGGTPDSTPELHPRRPSTAVPVRRRRHVQRWSAVEEAARLCMASPRSGQRQPTKIPITIAAGGAEWQVRRHIHGSRPTAPGRPGVTRNGRRRHRLVLGGVLAAPARLSTPGWRCPRAIERRPPVDGVRGGPSWGAHRVLPAPCRSARIPTVRPASSAAVRNRAVDRLLTRHVGANL